MAWVGDMNGIGDEAMDKVGDMNGDGLRNMVYILKRQDSCKGAGQVQKSAMYIYMSVV